MGLINKGEKSMSKQESIQKMTDIMGKFVGLVGIDLPDDVTKKLAELREKEDSEL